MLHRLRALLCDELSVIPADAVLLQSLLDGDESFEALTGWRVLPELSYPDAVNFSLAAVRNGAAPRWSTHLFVHEADSAMMGIGGFKGAPEDGVVELGYAITPTYRGRGYATAAAAELVLRAAEAGVRVAVAHTLAHTNPSTSVLTRLGFTKVAGLVDPDDGPLWRWELALSE